MNIIGSTKDKNKMTTTSMAGPGFTEEQAAQADTMETWGTGFSDPGPDYCEFRLIRDEDVFATKRVDGY